MLKANEQRACGPQEWMVCTHVPLANAEVAFVLLHQSQCSVTEVTGKIPPCGRHCP